MPPELQAVANRLPWWVGPLIPPEQLPRLEIAHHGGGQATLVKASWGAEAHLTPALLPPELWSASIVHIAALSSAQRQLDFLTALKYRPGVLNSPRPLISVGTYARLVYSNAEQVSQLFAQADLLFMNENEANGLFGGVEQARTRPGVWLFVTLGQHGALVITEERVTHLPGRPAVELDPTGAGDTFCGATLAGLAAGLSPIAAAEQGISLAAEMIGAVGPAVLLKVNPAPGDTPPAVASEDKM
jgi:sugar/nucleoside kinase (ribokinase family)